MAPVEGFGIIVVGSELLSGKRRDGHLERVIELLGARGLDLDWARYLGDSPARITAALRETMAGGDAVLCFGGIGATPDDHTRACAAEAAGVALARHPEAAAIIEARFGGDAYPRRIHMAYLPEGCELIPNPVNRIAGFSLGHHHFVPGFPQMAWPMTQWVLETRYASAFRGEPAVERIVTLPGTSEGAVMSIMEAFVECYPALRLSCLPHMDGDYRETELGVRGERAAVEVALRWLTTELDAAGFEWHEAARGR